MAGVRHSGLSNVTSSDMTQTDDLTVGDDLAVTGDITVTGAAQFNGNTGIGNSIADTFSLYGKTKVSQPRGASQAALTTLTGTKSTTNVAAKLNALILRWGKMRTDLIALGAIKGAT
jgi:hypothetical protein